MMNQFGAESSNSSLHVVSFKVKLKVERDTAVGVQHFEKW